MHVFRALNRLRQYGVLELTYQPPMYLLPFLMPATRAVGILKQPMLPLWKYWGMQRCSFRVRCTPLCQCCKYHIAFPLFLRGGRRIFNL